MKRKKFLMIFICVFLIQLNINYSYTVEPEEVLKNQNQELRARNI